jgi:hypothetical protein
LAYKRLKLKVERPAASRVSTGFMFMFDLVNLRLSKIRHFGGLSHTQGFALGLAPACQAFDDLGFIALVGWVIEICP